MWKFPKLVVPLKVADMGSRNSKTEGQLRLGEIVRVFPYLLDLVWVKFCHSVAHSVMRLEPLSSLGALICNVISLGSKPKVGRIDASRIVSSRAIVKNKQARWDLSEVNNPAGPMSQNISGEPPALTNHSVPVGPDRSNPYPTIIGKSYFGEESGEKGGIESKFLKGCHALIIAPRLCIATPNKLFSIWWILSLFLCLSAPAQLPVIPYSLPPSGAAPPPSGLTIWLKPESIVQADNTSIDSWPDSSGNNHNFSSTTTKWTNAVVHGYGGAWCNGTAFFIGTNSDAVMQNVAGSSMFIVTKILTTAAFGILATHQAGTSFQRSSFTTDAGGKLTWQGRTLDADSVRTVGTVANNPVGFFLAECVVSNSTGRIWWYTNGVLVGNSALLTAANTSNTAGTSHPSWGQMEASVGKVICVEYLYYARPVSDAERTNSIEPYFLTKYGPW